MGRLFARAAALTAIIIGAYACSSTGGDEPATDGGTPVTEGGVEDSPSTEDGAKDGGADVLGDTGGGDAGGDADVDAGAPGVRFVGRRDLTDPANPKFSWPGARIIARFSGTEVKVTLDETSGVMDGPSRWDVLVDGVRTMTLTPADGLGTYTLASGLPAGIHKIELWKRTEGKVGVTQFKGYEFPGGVLLAPPSAPNRRIELLSDSTTTGYGIECASPNEAFTAATQNERLAYGGLVATDLGADHHNVSYSGKGVLLNNLRSDLVLYDQLFPRSLHEGPQDWNFANFTPDVVWMMLGSNDWDEGTPPSMPDPTAFTNKFISLAALVRSKYPSAHIFFAIAPSLNDDYPPGYQALTNMRNAMAATVTARAAAGDNKTYVYEFDRTNYPTDVTGCGYHANLAMHRKMADQVIAQIKAKTGWL
jgi:lysophospholipase L1-like esterase